MSVRFLPLFLLWLPLSALAQTDSLPATKEQQIALIRQELRRAFINDNGPDVQYWLEILRRQEDAFYLTTLWDERWLLYFWLENYSLLLQEAGQFKSLQEYNNQDKYPPPADSLFEQLDNRLYANREQIFAQIDAALLNSEEKEFLGLLLEFLLRLNVTDEALNQYDHRLSVFLENYPDSKFTRIIRKRMFNSLPPADWGVSLGLLLDRANWTDQLERSFKPGFGLDIQLTYWKKRWNTQVNLSLGAQKLSRDVVESGYIWPKDDPSTFLGLDLELGYDLINMDRFRLYPTLGVGYSNIHPPASDEEDNPNPDYYDLFHFGGLHLTGAIQADVKLNGDATKKMNSYHAVRVRLGYRHLKLGDDNPAVMGNMFFFAVGYNLFGRQSVEEN